MITFQFAKSADYVFLLPTIAVSRGECSDCGARQGWLIEFMLLMWGVGIAIGENHHHG